MDLKAQKVIKDYGKTHGCIYSIAITSDDKYLLTSGFEANGHVKQFLVSSGKMIKDYGPIFEDGVGSITKTPDNKWLFASSFRGGRLKQISLKSQQVVHDYGKIHDDRIHCLETTRDSKWLITASWDTEVKRISVDNRVVDKVFRQVINNYITRMKITADGEKVLVGDSRGYLKLISSRNGEVIIDFRRAHSSEISGIVISMDQKSFFTSSMSGDLRQWN
jgi:WD40 repeat protein